MRAKYHPPVNRSQRKAQGVFTPNVLKEMECPIPTCQKKIWVAPGQKVYGCGEHRKVIKEHNRRWKARNPSKPDPEKTPRFELPEGVQ